MKNVINENGLELPVVEPWPEPVSGARTTAAAGS